MARKCGAAEHASHSEASRLARAEDVVVTRRGFTG